MADPAKYRTAADVEQWKARDPIKVLGEKLDTLGLTPLRTQIEQEVEDEVQDSVRFAEESPFPHESTAMDYVYV